MGTSLSTFASSTTITRPTRNPPPISLLDFDPRRQIPPWVPDPDPHAHFLTSTGLGSDGRVNAEGKGGGDNGNANRRAESRGEQSGTRGCRAANEARTRRNPNINRQVRRKEPLITIVEEEFGNETDTEVENDYDGEEEEEYTNINMDDYGEEPHQGINTSQDMYFRERYFERRRWKEEHDLPYSYHRMGYGVGIGHVEGGGHGGGRNDGEGRGYGGSGGGGRRRRRGAEREVRIAEEGVQ